MTCCPTCYTELLVTATGLECPKCRLLEWTCSACGQGVEGHSATVAGPVGEWPSEIPMRCPIVPVRVDGSFTDSRGNRWRLTDAGYVRDV